MDAPIDPIALGANPAYAIVALAGFIAWIRTTDAGKRLDGPVLVPAVTLGLGAAAGAALQFLNVLTYAPYSTWAAPVGGLAYGILIGGSAVLGVSLFGYGAGKLTGDNMVKSATDYVINLLRERFAGTIPAAVWAAVGPLLLQLATSDAVLTDELRRELQAKVLDALRKAGLEGEDL